MIKILKSKAGMRDKKHKKYKITEVLQIIIIIIIGAKILIMLITK